MFKRCTSMFAALLLTGCANNAVVELQKLDANAIGNKNILVIDDGRTKDSIRHVITSKLDEHGFKYKVVETSQSNSASSQEPKLIYSANWWWDVATYMRYLNVEIVDNGTVIALVKIDTVMCGGFDKFGSAQRRTELSLDLLLSDLSKEEANKLICLGGESNN